MPPIQSDPEFQEANTIVFEWRLRDLRALFDARLVSITYRDSALCGGVLTRLSSCFVFACGRLCI
jgi:hypothetical protein